ncbi:hypothetical protein STEG23_037009, partial [Scotinomys teguina]
MPRSGENRSYELLFLQKTYKANQHVYSYRLTQSQNRESSTHQQHKKYKLKKFGNEKH